MAARRQNSTENTIAHGRRFEDLSDPVACAGVARSEVTRCSHQRKHHKSALKMKMNMKIMLSGNGRLVRNVTGYVQVLHQQESA
jgi:hypothetical protein